MIKRRRKRGLYEATCQFNFVDVLLYYYQVILLSLNRRMQRHFPQKDRHRSKVRSDTVGKLPSKEQALQVNDCPACIRRLRQNEFLLGG